MVHWQIKVDELAKKRNVCHDDNVHYAWTYVDCDIYDEFVLLLHFYLLLKFFCKWGEKHGHGTYIDSIGKIF